MLSRTLPQPEEIILKPTRWRVFAVNFLLLSLASTLGFLLRSLFDWNTATISYFLRNLPIFLGLFVGLSVLLAFNHQAYAIRISVDALEGPTGSFFKRARFLKKDLDHDKTLQSFQHRLFLYRVITAHTDQIIFYEWFFDPTQSKRLKEILGIS